MTVPLRPTSTPVWSRVSRGWRKLRATPDWAEFAGADWPDRIMAQVVTDRFFAKQGRTISRWTVNAADGRTLVVYLKRHYVLPRIVGRLAAIFPWRAWSPGLQEWNNLNRAAKLGLPVPRAVAAAETLTAGGKLQSFLAVEELTNQLALHEAIPLAAKTLSPHDFNIWKTGLAKELARLSRLLHDQGYFHKDLYLCHFYIHQVDCACIPEKWEQRVTVIDLHRLKRHRLLGFLYRIKDLAQLLYSSEVRGVRNVDRQTFWKAYRGKRGRWLLRRLTLMKWRIYRKHNRKRANVATAHGGKK